MIRQWFDGWYHTKQVGCFDSHELDYPTLNHCDKFGKVLRWVLQNSRCGRTSSHTYPTSWSKGKYDRSTRSLVVDQRWEDSISPQVYSDTPIQKIYNYIVYKIYKVYAYVQTAHFYTYRVFDKDFHIANVLGKWLVNYSCPANVAPWQLLWAAQHVTKVALYLDKKLLKDNGFLARSLDVAVVVILGDVAVDHVNNWPRNWNSRLTAVVFK